MNQKTILIDGSLLGKNNMFGINIKKCKCCFELLFNDSVKISIEKWHKKAFYLMTGNELRSTTVSEDYLCFECVKKMKIFTDSANAANTSAGAQQETKNSEEENNMTKNFIGIQIYGEYDDLSQQEKVEDSSQQIRMEIVDEDALNLETGSSAILKFPTVPTAPKTSLVRSNYPTLPKSKDKNINQKDIPAPVNDFSQTSSKTQTFPAKERRFSIEFVSLGENVKTEKEIEVQECNAKLEKLNSPKVVKITGKKSPKIRENPIKSPPVNFTNEPTSASSTATADISNYSFTYDLCGLKAKFKRILSDHDETTGSNYKCSITGCNKSFGWKTILWQHLNYAHSCDTHQQASPSERRKKSFKETFLDPNHKKVRIAKKISQSIDHKRKNMRGALKNKPKEVKNAKYPGNPGKFKCNTCLRELKSLISLRMNVKNVHEKFKCDRCDKAFPTQDLLKGHESINASNHGCRRWHCSYPGCKFTSAWKCRAIKHLHKAHFPAFQGREAHDHVKNLYIILR